NGGSITKFSLPEATYIHSILEGIELPSEVSRAAHEASTLRDLIAVLEEADLNTEAQQFREELKDSFGPAPDSWGALNWYVGKHYLEPRLPKFVYFDDYRLLPGKVNLPTLRLKAEKKSIEDDEQTVLALLRMANVD